MSILNSTKQLVLGRSHSDQRKTLKSNAQSMVRHSENSSIEFISVSDKCFIELRQNDGLYNYRIMCERYDERTDTYYFEESSFKESSLKSQALDEAHSYSYPPSFDSRTKAVAAAKEECQQLGR